MAKPLNESFHEGSHNNLFILLIIIAIVTTTRIILLLISELNLHGDEAQYWRWSQELDWGYFTTPPLIAWAIHLTTLIFGNSEWAVRLSSPLFHAGTSLFCALLATELFGRKALIWTGIIF